MYKIRGNKIFRLLDKYIGIPILLIGSLYKILKNLKKSYFNKNDIKHIGLIKLFAIGDTVLLTGVIKDIKTYFPNSKISFFCSKNNYEVVRLIEEIDHINVLSLTNPISDLAKIRRRQFDIIIDFEQWVKLSSVYSLFSKSKFKIGFKTKGQYRHYIYDFYTEHSNNIHEINNFQNLVKLIGIKTHNSPYISLKRINFPNNLPEKYIIFHPWASGSYKREKEWPNENWVLLAKKIRSISNIPILISGSKSDIEDSKILESLFIESGINNIINIAGKYNLNEMIGVIYKSYLVISVNTGIMHISAILDKPLISLHGPTNPNRWGPIGKNSIIIIPNKNDCGFLNLGFEKTNKKVECMKYISVEIVFEKFLELAKTIPL